MRFSGKKIAVGITGGIAAYKSCEIVSLLRKQGADVFVVMTKNACNFATPLTLETLSGNRVVVDMFDRNFEYEVGHISLAKKVDAFLIAPATANFVAKFANGIADDFLSTTIMAFTKSVVIAPAMNTNMLQSAAYQANEMTLKNRGVHFIESGSGRLACGDDGKGRLADPSEIVDYLYSIISPNNDFVGKTIMVTAGATSENIDPVRFITNRSSGKMGLAIARNAKNRGAKVILVHGNMSETIENNFDETIKVGTTEQMYNAVMDNMDKCDIIIKAAAPSDYKVEQSTQKIKSESLVLTLTKNPDIAKAVGERKGDKKLVIFSAETEDLIKNASGKLKRKNADMVVANDVTQAGAGFDVDTNIVTLITANKQTSYDKMSKHQVAQVILDAVKEL